MALVFTICSNNYLAQATVLGNSLKRYNDNIKFFTILVDEFNPAINYANFPFTCVEIKDIEPNIDRLMEMYDIIELNTCVKPQIFHYFLSNYEDDEIIYFDPDIKLYSDLTEITSLLENNNIILTPHIFTPIDIDNKSPNENIFLNYGIYNLGFIGVKKSKETIDFVNWWKQRTYTNGYNNVCEGIFVDQLYINLVPIFFKGVLILLSKGYNMAPWNLHERYLSEDAGVYIVNRKDKLVFFHFSSFTINTAELPIHKYNRFTMADRSDLISLFADYNTDLSLSNYDFFKKFPCVYYKKYELIKRKQLLMQKQQNWNKNSPFKKIAIRLINVLPSKLLNKVKSLVNQSPLR